MALLSVPFTSSFWCVVIAIVLKFSQAQLAPSGQVLVCPDTILEMTCNETEENFLQWIVMSQQIQPPVPYAILSSDQSSVGRPLSESPRAPGITATPRIVSSAIISSTLTVDVSRYDLRTRGPIEVSCTEEYAAIRLFGKP